MDMDNTDGTSLLGLETATNSHITWIARDAIPVKGEFKKGKAILYLGRDQVSELEIKELQTFKQAIVRWITDKLKGLYVIFCHHQNGDSRPCCPSSAWHPYCRDRGQGRSCSSALKSRFSKSPTLYASDGPHCQNNLGAEDRAQCMRARS